MEIEIHGVPKFYWTPTLAHIAVLMTLSEHHYDGMCKAAGRQGGFIYGWKNRVEYREAGERFDVSATFHDFDLCLKIMEGAHLAYLSKLVTDNDMKLVVEMKNGFHRALQLANETNWKLSAEV